MRFKKQKSTEIEEDTRESMPDLIIDICSKNEVTQTVPRPFGTSACSKDGARSYLASILPQSSLRRLRQRQMQAAPDSGAGHTAD